MADRVLTQKTSLGQTFLNAMWIIGFIALLQVVAVSYAVYKRSGEVNSQAVSIQTPVATEPVELTAVAPTPAIQPITEIPTQPIDIESFVEVKPKQQNPALVKLKRPAPDLSSIDDPAGIIEDNIFLGLVENGRFYRREKDYDRALSNFRNAKNNLPDHPLILSEIAGTLGEMGELEEASKYWTEVTALGPLIGGEFFHVASRMLNGQNPMAPKFKDGQIIKLGKIREQRLGVTSEGEKVVITIPVFGNSEMGNIDVKKLSWNATFYDLINNQTIGPSIAKVIDTSDSGPYDWKDEVEELEAIYLMPTNSSTEQQFRAKRAYAGYGIKLFYDGILQDNVASSEAIGDLMFSTYIPVAPSPNVDSSLFPSSNLNR